MRPHGGGDMRDGEDGSDGPCWSEAPDTCQRRRDPGGNFATLAVARMGRTLLRGNSVAYRLAEAAVSANRRESQRGCRGAPRLPPAALRPLAGQAGRKQAV